MNKSHFCELTGHFVKKCLIGHSSVCARARLLLFFLGVETPHKTIRSNRELNQYITLCYGIAKVHSKSRRKYKLQTDSPTAIKAACLW